MHAKGTNAQIGFEVVGPIDWYRNEIVVTVYLSDVWLLGTELDQIHTD